MTLLYIYTFNISSFTIKVVRQQIKGEAKILSSSYSAIHCCI